MLDVTLSPATTIDSAEALERDIRDLFVVRDVTVDWPEHDSIRFRGTFLCELATEFDELRRRFERHGFTPLVREDGGEPILIALPQVFEKTSPRWLLSLILFVATIGSTMLVGAAEEIFAHGLWPGILSGWPFSLCILLILGAHELGHYFAARYHNVSTTLPYFIPIPTIIGTMGAFIQIKEPIKNRRALFDIGAAGPLAGLVFAIPILLYGLATSGLVEQEPCLGCLEGNSLLYAGAKVLLKGQFYPADGIDIGLNQVAWAGWSGLLVTGLNLLPIGQLDGGHISYVLFGRKAKSFFWPVVIGLLAISLLLQTQIWLLWVALLFFFGRNHATPLDDVTPLDSRRRALAILTLLIFVLIFVPNPIQSIP